MQDKLTLRASSDTFFRFRSRRNQALSFRDSAASFLTKCKNQIKPPWFGTEEAFLHAANYAQNFEQSRDEDGKRLEMLIPFGRIAGLQC